MSCSLSLAAIVLAGTAGGPGDLRPKAFPGNYVMKFDGNKTTVVMGFPVPPELPAGTIEVWFRLSRDWSWKRVHVPLVSQGGDHLLLSLSRGKLFFRKNVDHQGKDLSAPVPDPGHQWHHAAATWGQHGMCLCWDGKLLAANGDRTQYQGRRTVWNLGYRFTGERFKGDMDCVRISHVQRWWADFRPPKRNEMRPDAATTYYLPFAPDDVPIVHDRSGRMKLGIAYDAKIIRLEP